MERDGHVVAATRFGSRAQVAWLGGLTILISLLSEIVCNAIEGAAEAWHVPPVFVGFVLLPIVGNAAEHATAIGMAYRGKLDLAIAVRGRRAGRLLPEVSSRGESSPEAPVLPGRVVSRGARDERPPRKTLPRPRRRAARSAF